MMRQRSEEVMPELSSQHLVEAIDVELDARVQNLGLQPRLAILSDNIEHPPSLMYVGIKQKVARKLGIVATAVFTNGHAELHRNISDYNSNADYHGMIVQLPLSDHERTEEVLNKISVHKDVDGLRSDLLFAPATPLGILSLIDGYNIDYKNSCTALIGKGKLVGAPLLRLMQQRGASNIQAFDVHSTDEEVRVGLNKADIVISATGQPGLLVPEMFDELDRDRVFIDAGAAESGGVVVGDISDELRHRALQNGCLITPKKGGIGPLTVRALLSNVVQAAEYQKDS
jgi:methylenetetrahydrofolate dehydrogenase (NADP+)/methenyltetrahydrofolate cyclohydrolase